ncbi:hypothetical protein D3C76_1759080 [compost metagenome]
MLFSRAMSLARLVSMPMALAASMTVCPASASSLRRGACLLRSMRSLLLWEVPNMASRSPLTPEAIS